MAYFQDLSPCFCFGQWEELLLAVGWLDSEHGFTESL
ncbi:hypothetical protein COSO111634_26030 [Corallococcus soli]